MTTSHGANDSFVGPDLQEPYPGFSIAGGTAFGSRITNPIAALTLCVLAVAFGVVVLITGITVSHSVWVCLLGIVIALGLGTLSYFQIVRTVWWVKFYRRMGFSPLGDKAQRWRYEQYHS